MGILSGCQRQANGFPSRAVASPGITGHHWVLVGGCHATKWWPLWEHERDPQMGQQNGPGGTCTYGQAWASAQVQRNVVTFNVSLALAVFLGLGKCSSCQVTFGQNVILRVNSMGR